jgi:hypothetical protein
LPSAAIASATSSKITGIPAHAPPERSTEMARTRSLLVVQMTLKQQGTLKELKKAS